MGGVAFVFELTSYIGLAKIVMPALGKCLGSQAQMLILEGKRVANLKQSSLKFSSNTF
jgi:hypothetical protein